VVRSIDHLLDDVLAPLLHVPRHPITLAAYGTRALLPATVIASRWRQPEARALFAGSAAHLIGPLTAPLSGAIGIILIAAAHAYGWPVAKGGSQAIADAMAAKLVSLGGEILTNSPVESVRALGTADVVMLDVAPRHAARLLGDRVPPRTQRAYDRFRHGPAAHKVDFAIRGHIPWVNDACRRAGTVHLSGTLEEIVAVERQMADGTMPERPFCLIGQQYLADPSRSAGDINPIWAYAHVPHAYRAMPPRRSSGRSNAMRPGSAARSSQHTCVHLPTSRHTTPTMWVATSAPGPTRRCRSSCAHAGASGRTTPVHPGCSCAPPPPHRAPGCTGCADCMLPSAHSHYAPDSRGS